MVPVVDLTLAAVTKLREIMEEQKASSHFLRVVVEKTEQGGASYKFGIDEKADEADSVIKGDVNVVVDPNSIELLRGARIDYIETFERSGFTVTNPNFSGSCACGKNGGGCGGGGGN